MSKTFKDKANYYKHHTKHNNSIIISKGKRKIAPEHIPTQLKDMVAKLEYNYTTALRHGNTRKTYAEMKVAARKIKRAKEKMKVRNELKEV